MMRENTGKCPAIAAVTLCLCLCLLYSPHALGSDTAPAPQMPSHWKVTSDRQVQAQHVKSMGSKLGAELTSVRNIVYDVNGKLVQINVICTPDLANAEKLMTKLSSMKTEEALLRKELTVYEFVGQNDVLPVIAEGRKHLAAL